MLLTNRPVRFRHVSGKTTVEVSSSSIDLAVRGSLGEVFLVNYLTNRSPLSWPMTPSEAREYAARLLKAADQAEEGASDREGKTAEEAARPQAEAPDD